MRPIFEGGDFLPGAVSRTQLLSQLSCVKGKQTEEYKRCGSIISLAAGGHGLCFLSLLYVFFLLSGIEVMPKDQPFLRVLCAVVPS